MDKATDFKFGLSQGPCIQKLIKNFAEKRAWAWAYPGAAQSL